MNRDLNHIMYNWRNDLLSNTEILHLLICLSTENTTALHEVQMSMHQEHVLTQPAPYGWDSTDLADQYT
jgi:hypothetical protein